MLLAGVAVPFAAVPFVELDVVTLQLAFAELEVLSVFAVLRVV